MKKIALILILIICVILSSCNAYYKLSSSYKPESVKCSTYNDTKPHYGSINYKKIDNNYPKSSNKNKFNPYKQYK